MIPVDCNFVAFLKSRHVVPKVPSNPFLKSRHPVPDVTTPVPDIPTNGAFPDRQKEKRIGTDG
jgi:hypothetical protein